MLAKASLGVPIDLEEQEGPATLLGELLEYGEALAIPTVQEGDAGMVGVRQEALAGRARNSPSCNPNRLPTFEIR